MPKKTILEIDKRSVQRLQRQFRQLQKTAAREIPAEIDSMMQDVLTESKKEVPVSTGRLKESGRLAKSGQGARKGWEVRFGGISIRGKFVNYAIAVHERQKKFLTESFDKSKSVILKQLHRKMDKLLKSASKL